MIQNSKQAHLLIYSKLVFYTKLKSSVSCFHLGLWLLTCCVIGTPMWPSLHLPISGLSTLHRILGSKKYGPSSRSIKNLF